MPKEEIINGLRVRVHIASNTKVSEDGEYVERTWNDNGVIKKYHPKIHRDDNSGRSYVENVKKQRTYIDEMVITCFGRPKPDDYGYYVISHKDGDAGNNHYKNLAWVASPAVQHLSPIPMSQIQPATPVPKAVTDKVTRYIHPVLYDVKRDGTIWQEKTQLVPLLLRDNKPTTPLVGIRIKDRWGKDLGVELYAVEDLMNDAGFISGNKEVLTNPVILHLDNDYTNCASTNLVWVEADDLMYKLYKNQMAADMGKPTS